MPATESPVLLNYRPQQGNLIVSDIILRKGTFRYQGQSAFPQLRQLLNACISLSSLPKSHKKRKGGGENTFKAAMENRKIRQREQ